MLCICVRYKISQKEQEEEELPQGERDSCDNYRLLGMKFSAIPYTTQNTRALSYRRSLTQLEKEKKTYVLVQSGTTQTYNKTSRFLILPSSTIITIAITGSIPTTAGDKKQPVLRNMAHDTAAATAIRLWLQLPLRGENESRECLHIKLLSVAHRNKRRKKKRKRRRNQRHDNKSNSNNDSSIKEEPPTPLYHCRCPQTYSIY